MSACDICRGTGEELDNSCKVVTSPIVSYGPSTVGAPSSPLHPLLADTGELDHVTGLELAGNKQVYTSYIYSLVSVGVWRGERTFLRVVSFRLKCYFNPCSVRRPHYNGIYCQCPELHFKGSIKCRRCCEQHQRKQRAV